MAASPVVPTEQDGIAVKAYTSDGSVLLTFNLDQTLTPNLAGFAIRCTPPSGAPYDLINRLSFSRAVTAALTAEQRVFTPTSQAPIQKFRWMDFPANIQSGAYQYQVTAMYFDGNGGLKAGPAASAEVLFQSLETDKLQMGFTRGYASSQAYSDHFHNAPIEPSPKTFGFDTTPYQAQYQWLGYHARKLVFDFLQESIADPSVTVDLFAYDLDEPDFIRGLQQLGPRLRAVLDDAPLHTKPGAMEIQAKAALIQSTGAANIVSGHFKRFAHSKVLIQKRGGAPVKVLTGSANFSLRGLYVQANNILVFDDATTAGLYEQAFNQAFSNMKGFTNAPIAQGWFDVSQPGLPPFAVAFSPHRTAGISLDRVSQAIQNAGSSVIYAVMELKGGGDVLSQLQNLGNNPKLFAYGITQSDAGLNLYKPGQIHGEFADFAFLSKLVPAPFRQEWSGGIGQVIHDKFVVVDFNSAQPVVFTGSSNLAEGGEEDNGDNLLAIYDPPLVTAYAVEAIRLVDHYHFRVAMKGASQVQPLVLQGPGAAKPWWQPYYDPQNVKYYDRTLFAGSNVTMKS